MHNKFHLYPYSLHGCGIGRGRISLIRHVSIVTCGRLSVVAKRSHAGGGATRRPYQLGGHLLHQLHPAVLLQHPRSPANGAPAGCGSPGVDEKLRHGQDQGPGRDEAPFRQDGVLHTLVRPTPICHRDQQPLSTILLTKLKFLKGFSMQARSTISFAMPCHSGVGSTRCATGCDTHTHTCLECAASFKCARKHAALPSMLTRCHLQDVAEFHSQLLELLSDAFAKCSSAKPKSPKPDQKMSDDMIKLTTELQV